MALGASFHGCSRVHFLTVVERGGEIVRNGGLNLRKGRSGRRTVTADYQHHAVGHGAKKNRPATETVLAGRPRDTVLIGQTYSKDAGGSCSDLPNYCEYAPRFRAEHNRWGCRTWLLSRYGALEREAGLAVEQRKRS